MNVIGYLHPAGTLPKRLADTPEERVVCIPLAPEDAPDRPFAVAHIS